MNLNSIYMTTNKPLIKKIIIRYNTIEEVIEREPYMRETLDNYLTREKDYEFYQSYMEAGETKFRLVLEIKLKDEDTSR